MEDKELVLVVEDNLEQNQLICKIVKKLSYDTVSACNGLEAFQVLHKNRRGWGFMGNNVSCIILDWNMPVMNGMEFIKILRKKERFNTFRRFIPIIILTAFEASEKRDLAACNEEGLVAGYLAKPFDKSELADLLNKILKHKESEILRDNFRESRYKRSTKDEFFEYRESFYKGNLDYKAERYLHKKIELADKEYKEALYSQEAEESRLEVLLKVKEFYQEQLEKFNSGANE